MTPCAALLIGGTLAIASCVLDGPTTPGKDLASAGLQLLGDSLLVLGDSLILTVEIRDVTSDGPQRIAWSSSDSSVAVVDTLGVVRGVGAGSADITVRLTAPDIVGAVVRSKAIDVMFNDIGIESQDSLTGLGEKRLLVARALGTDGTLYNAVPATFTTTDTSIISLSDSGTVTALQNGVANVTATHAGLTASTQVRIRQVAKTVAFAMPELYLPVLQMDTVVPVSVFDTEDSLIVAPQLTWSSSDPSVVTVTNTGVIRAVSASVAIVTAQSDTASAQLPVRVEEGPAFLVVNAGDNQTAQVGATLPTRPAVLVRNASGAPMDDVTVVFNVSSGGGQITDSVLVTDQVGIATIGSWTLGIIAGTQTLTARAGGLSTVITVTAISAPISTSASTVSTSPDTVAAGSVSVLALQARDGYGNPVTTGGLTVTFSASGGTSTGSIGPTVDNGDGTYIADFSGELAGTATTIDATIDGTPVTSTSPTVTVVAGPPTQMDAVSGDDQSTMVGLSVPIAPTVIVYDDFGNPVPSASVTFTVTGGDGTVTGSPSTTNGAGRAALTSWTLGLVAGVNTLSAIAGTAQYNFTATTTVPSTIDTVFINRSLVGNEPYAVAVDNNYDNVFVANRGSDYITVLDAVGDTAVATVTVGGAPVGVAVHRMNHRAYVASQGTNTLTVVDGSTFSVVTTISLGESPAGVAVDEFEGRVYVALPMADEVAVINAATNTVETTVTVGTGPSWLGADAPNSLLYVSNTTDGTVSVIDTQGPDVIETLTVGTAPQGIGIDDIAGRAYVATADGIVVLDGTNVNDTIALANGDYRGVTAGDSPNRVYVADATLGQVIAIDGSSFNIVGTVAVTSTPNGIAISDDEGRIYVADPVDHAITVVESNMGGIENTHQFIGGPRDVAVHSTSGLVYIVNELSDNVSVMDATSHAFVNGPIAVGDAPVGLAVNEATDRLYVTNSSDGTVSIINTQTGGTVSTPNVGTTPQGVDVNAVINRIYVANYDDNTVSVIEGSTNLVMATIAVGSQPTDIAVDTTNNRVYVSHESDDVWVIDGGTNGLIGTIGPLGGSPPAIGVVPAVQRVFAPDADTPGAVWMLDASSSSVLSLISVDGVPEAIGVNPATGLVVVPTNAAINFLNGATGSVVYSIFTGTTSLGVGLDPVTNKAFVADGGTANAIVVVQN